MTHPLVAQLRFTRNEFMRSVAGVNDEDAGRRLLPMNSLGWNVGHLAWHEQRALVTFTRKTVVMPDLNTLFANGAPACTPALSGMVSAWRAITAEADIWLDAVTTEGLLATFERPGGRGPTNYGNILQRVVYHYWYHTGENMAIRQQLGHAGLPDFVGNIDGEASFYAG